MSKLFCQMVFTSGSYQRILLVETNGECLANEGHILERVRSRNRKIDVLPFLRYDVQLSRSLRGYMAGSYGKNLAILL